MRVDVCAYVGSVHLIIPGDPARHAEDIELSVIRPGHGFGEVALVHTHMARPSDAATVNSDCTLLRLSSELYDLVVNALQTEELIRTVHYGERERHIWRRERHIQRARDRKWHELFSCELFSARNTS